MIRDSPHADLLSHFVDFDQHLFGLNEENAFLVGRVIHHHAAHETELEDGVEFTLVRDPEDRRVHGLNGGGVLSVGVLLYEQRAEVEAVLVAHEGLGDVAFRRVGRTCFPPVHEDVLGHLADLGELALALDLDDRGLGSVVVLELEFSVELAVDLREELDNEEQGSLGRQDPTCLVLKEFVVFDVVEGLFDIFDHHGDLGLRNLFFWLLQVEGLISSFDLGGLVRDVQGGLVARIHCLALSLGEFPLLIYRAVKMGDLFDDWQWLVQEGRGHDLELLGLVFLGAPVRFGDDLLEEGLWHWQQVRIREGRQRDLFHGGVHQLLDVRKYGEFSQFPWCLVDRLQHPVVDLFDRLFHHHFFFDCLAFGVLLLDLDLLLFDVAGRLDDLQLGQRDQG